jgi:predicted O-linked N-acetylglucosamine transferase (SPINDLY family)
MTAQDHNREGDQLQAQGRFKESVSAYGRAIQADPTFFPAWYSAGCALNSLTEYGGALPCFEKAIALNPAHVESHHNYGTSLYQLGRLDEAIASFRKANHLRPNPLSSTAIATTIPGSPSATHGEVLAARRQWAAQHLPAPNPPSHAPHTPLRLGYISSFFQSPNWMKPVWGVINHHDRTQFQVHLFSDAPQSACAGYQPQESDRFTDLTGLSNADAAARIRQAEIDILIDLNSYSQVDRLPVLAEKPAPILAAWFNLYATSGIPAYDYLIGDHHVIHPEEERFYTEKIARVEGSYLTFQVQYETPPVTPTTGPFTFGSFASLYKLTPQVIAVWAEILKNTPARLFLKNGLLHRPSNVHYIREAFESHKIDPARIECDGRSPHFSYLAAYSKVDLALDPFPYNGGTTTSEALWQGVPVLTLDGDRWAARQGASLLRAARLDQFIAANEAEYIEKAVAFSQNLPALRLAMREHLLRSPVCDSPAFTRNLEALYRQFLVRLTL